MAKLWLTYAWKDNEDSQLDLVVASLKAAGVEVLYDRIHLVVGVRIWPQIDAVIRDPSVSALAIYITENSLKSEPCQEELAYALDRALRNKGKTFKLIGIFPSPVAAEYLPSSIATRLYVTLNDPHWADRIASAVLDRPHDSPLRTPRPYGLTVRPFQNKICVEVWPIVGQWVPFIALTPRGEGGMTVLSEPRGRNSHVSTVYMHSHIEAQNGLYTGEEIGNVVDVNMSAHIYFKTLPSELIIGTERHWHRITREELEEVKQS